MKKIYNYKKKFLTILLVLGLVLSANNLLAQLPFYDGFESGNFTSGNWTVNGNSEISTDSPYEGTYCVKGPGSYSFEQNFSPIQDNVVTIEYAMKASQTGSVCVNQYVKDVNDKISCYVAFRWNGNIVAKNGPLYDSIIDLQPYSIDVWYDMKVVLNMSQKTYDVYIDGELKADDFDFVDNDFSNPSLFRWISGETWGTGWVDDIYIYTENPPNNLPFSDCFESGNFTSENWTVTGNSEISTEDPFEGSYCVKGSGSYSLEQNFDPIVDNKVTIEYTMKASQTNKVCVALYIYDQYLNTSAIVLFNHSGNIGATNGTSGFEEFLSYSADIWYKIKVVLDNTSKTFDVFVNDELKADDFDYFSSQFTLPTKFWWGTSETSGIGWLDCIDINAGNVGINDIILNQNKISIYPNPVKNYLNIDVIQNARGEIYSMQGMLIKSISTEEINGQVNISKLPNGIYLLNLINTKGELIKSEKIIKE